MLWATSPACTELETHVLDWLADMLDCPAFPSTAGGGVIQESASSASLCALLAARSDAANMPQMPKDVGANDGLRVDASPFVDRKGHDGGRAGTREFAAD